ncbi:complex I NDUFA9 subunit family protein [Phanerochaete sordida]|uniref:Complex I NDUFA9 subunit family protein n=1 Tax=Phanerochaete sordida TaxID=48140 RepID=A0A9P3G099_9APHY|nr:complex I NDUFA9 subunit family protein [Phanerochaete sordida]
MSLPKVVICGAGFLGSAVARAVLSASRTPRRVLLVSRNNTAKAHAEIAKSLPKDQQQRLEPPMDADITKPETLVPAMEGADVVVSLVGLMNGTVEDFERIQWRGAENVAKAAEKVHAKVIHVSAIGANCNSPVPYARTKALGEDAVLDACPSATIIRPSILFGKGDGFFARFAQLAKVLPFMPCFGGGTSKFQPVFVDDLARAIEILSRKEIETSEACDGKTIEAGGPEVFTYREIMELVLKYTNKRRPIVSVPYAVGTLQGLVLEQLPPNLFTITRAQVQQLKEDNVVNPATFQDACSFKDILANNGRKLTSVHEILPTYLPYV